MGGMGYAPSANLNPDGSYPSMFESVHGSAPDIAGKGIANPLATVWAGQLMLDFLDERDAAARLLAALETHVQEGKVQTPRPGRHELHRRRRRQSLRHPASLMRSRHLQTARRSAAPR